MPDLKVYGQTHSPWVQAALLGAYEKNVDHQLVTATPLPVLFRWGVTMPAAQFPGEDWMRESGDILERMGFQPVDHGQRVKIQMAWQGVLHRPDSAWRFFREFSLAGDSSDSLFRRSWQNFFRSFSSFYFYLLIRTMVLIVKPPEPDQFGDQFIYWEERLSSAPYLGGDQPNSEDILLFGIMQCHCSVPVPPTDAIVNDQRLEKLRAWITRMQKRFANYPYHYTANYFGDRQQLATKASRWDQFCFWMGLTTWIVTFPISIPAVILCRTRTPK
jgi:glutathione S-transferase